MTWPTQEQIVELLDEWDQGDMAQPSEDVAAAILALFEPHRPSADEHALCVAAKDYDDLSAQLASLRAHVAGLEKVIADQKAALHAGNQRLVEAAAARERETRLREKVVSVLGEVDDALRELRLCAT